MLAAVWRSQRTASSRSVNRCMSRLRLFAKSSMQLTIFSCFGDVRIAVRDPSTGLAAALSMMNQKLPMSGSADAPRTSIRKELMPVPLNAPMESISPLSSSPGLTCPTWLRAM